MRKKREVDLEARSSPLRWRPQILGGLILAVLFGGGCYEPKEGCLDINATNFAVDADQACLDCCTYPLLRMRFQHSSVYPDTVVNFRLLDSVYFDAGGNPYRVADFRFFLSELRLLRPDGTEVALQNRVAASVFRPGGALEPDSIDNDIILVRPPLTSLYDLGTLRANGAFSAIRFRIGIAVSTAAVDPESLPANHPLRPNASGMPWSQTEGFVFQRAVFLPGNMPEDTARVTVHIREPIHYRTVELPVNADIREGFDVEFEMRIDYLSWLRDISPATQTPEILLERLVSRTSSAFAVVNIR